MISRNSIGDAYPVKYLGEIVEFLDSKRRPVTESDRRAGPYPYYGANGQQGTIDDYIFDEPLVLLAEDGGHFETPERGIAYRISGKTWVNNHAHVLRPKSEIDIAFLCRVLENYDVTPFITGTTRGKLTKSGASEILIPLPPLEEQKRIADILDRAEALRVKRRAALAQLDELVLAIFIDIFGDLETNPKGWIVKGFDHFAKIDTKMVKDFAAHENKPHIGIENIEKDTGNLINYKEVGAQNLTSGKYLFTKDHIIYSKIRPNLNKVALPDFDGLCSADAYPLLVNKNNTNRYFFAYILRSKYFLNNILKLSDRTNIPKVNKDQLRSFECICPPIELQNRFAHRVETIEKLKKAHKASLVEIDELFASLQYRAFRGELGIIPKTIEQSFEGVKI